jgi:hypothetical protein
MKRLPTLRVQLAMLVLAAVCLPLVVVLSSGWVMLGMHDETKIIAVENRSAGGARVAFTLPSAGSRGLS